MRRVLLDVNVILDAILDRPPHSMAAAKLWALAETKEIDAMVPAHGVTTIFYLLARQKDAIAARRAVENIVATLGVATVDLPVIRRALTLTWPDFEDSVCAGAAEAAGCEMLITRDPSGFPEAPVHVVDPPTALALLSGGGPEHVAEEVATYDRQGRGSHLRGRAPKRRPSRARRRGSRI